MRAENPKHKQGDGAGFGRLRAEQNKRVEFLAIIHRAHPLGNVYVDQVREYAGAQIVFYRRTVETWEEARVGAFLQDVASGRWIMHSDTIVNTSGELA
jgi:hypothetical protein